MELCNPLTNVNDLRLMVRSQYALPKKIAAQMNRKKVCNAFQKCSGDDLPLPPMRYQKVNPTTGVYYPRDTPLSGRDFYSLFSDPKLKELQRLARKLGVFQKDATKSMLFMSITEFLKASGVPEPIQVRLTPNKVEKNLKPSNNNNNLKPSNNNNKLRSSNNNNNLRSSNNNNNLRSSNNLRPIAKRVGPPIGGPGPKRNNNTRPSLPPPVRRIPLPPTATPRLRDYEELMRKVRYGNERSIRSWAGSRGFSLGNYRNRGSLIEGLRRQQRDKLNIEDLRTLAKSLGMKNTSAYKTKNGLERAIYEYKKKAPTMNLKTTRGPPVRGPPVRRPPPPPAPKGPSNNNTKRGPPAPQIVEVTKAIKSKNVTNLRKLENSTNSNVAKAAKEARVAVETKNNSKLRRVAEETNKAALRNLRMYATRKGVKNAGKYETVGAIERAIKNAEVRPVSGSPNAALNAKLKETRAAANAARAAKNNRRAAELKEREMKLMAQIEKNKAAAANKLEREKSELATKLEAKKAEANAARRAKNAELTAKLEREKAELNARLERKKAEANAARSKPGMNFKLPNIQVPKIQRAPPEVREARREKVRSIFKSKVQKIFDEVYPGEEAGNKREANKFVAAIKKKGKNASSVNAIYTEIYGNKAQLEAEGKNVNAIMAKRAEFKRKLLGAVATVAQEAGVPQAEVTQAIVSEPTPTEKAAANRINKIFNAVYPTNEERGNPNNAEEFKTKIRNLGNKVNANSIEEVYKAVYALGKNNAKLDEKSKTKRANFTRLMLNYKKSTAPAAAASAAAATVSANKISSELKNIYEVRFGEAPKNTFITKVKNSNGKKETIMEIFDVEYGTRANIGRLGGTQKNVAIAIGQRESFANAATKYLTEVKKKNANAKTKSELNKINADAKTLADPYIKKKGVKNILNAVLGKNTINRKKDEFAALQDHINIIKGVNEFYKTNTDRAAKFRELIGRYDKKMDGFNDKVPDIYAEYFIEEGVGKPLMNRSGEYARTIQQLERLMKPRPYNYKRVLLAYVMNQGSNYNNAKNNLGAFLSKKPGSALLSTPYIKWLYGKAFKAAPDLYRQLVGLLKTDRTFLERLKIKSININTNGTVKLDGKETSRKFVIARAKLLKENPKVQGILIKLGEVGGVNKGATALAGGFQKMRNGARERINGKKRLGKIIKLATNLSITTTNYSKKLNSRNTKEVQSAINEIDSNIRTKLRRDTSNVVKSLGKLEKENLYFLIQEYSSDPNILAKIVEYTKRLSAANAQKIFDKLPANKNIVKNAIKARGLVPLKKTFGNKLLRTQEKTKIKIPPHNGGDSGIFLVNRLCLEKFT